MKNISSFFWQLGLDGSVREQFFSDSQNKARPSPGRRMRRKQRIFPIGRYTSYFYYMYYYYVLHFLLSFLSPSLRDCCCCCCCYQVCANIFFRNPSTCCYCCCCCYSRWNLATQLLLQLLLLLLFIVLDEESLLFSFPDNSFDKAVCRVEWVPPLPSPFFPPSISEPRKIIPGSRDSSHHPILGSV